MARPPSQIFSHESTAITLDLGRHGAWTGVENDGTESPPLKIRQAAGMTDSAVRPDSLTRPEGMEIDTREQWVGGVRKFPGSERSRGDGQDQRRSRCWDV